MLFLVSYWILALRRSANYQPKNDELGLVFLNTIIAEIFICAAQRQVAYISEIALFALFVYYYEPLNNANAGVLYLHVNVWYFLIYVIGAYFAVAAVIPVDYFVLNAILVFKLWYAM